MSSTIDELPDLSPIGGHWTIATVHADHTFTHDTLRGLAHLPGVEWEFQPENCPIPWGDWYLDHTLLLCSGCGIDAT
ncbi:hypothetical protein ACFXG4_23695 [Nocardia sp. NPDC059246]|uniref:hypothetical protein n=1 Tax=unclassified Nocardia TaxID=2637762 RepID=UPI00369B1EF3